MDKITFTAIKDRETKGTLRYAEEGEEDTQACRTLYIRKSALNKIGTPTAIKVTIEGK